MHYMIPANPYASRVVQLSVQLGDSGVTNMLDIVAVQRIAFDEGFYDLVCYIEEDKKRYFHFILSGQLPDGEENPAATCSSSTSSSLVEKDNAEDVVETADAHLEDDPKGFLSSFVEVPELLAPSVIAEIKKLL